MMVQFLKILNAISPYAISLKNDKPFEKIISSSQKGYPISKWPMTYPSFLCVYYLIKPYLHIQLLRTLAPLLQISWQQHLLPIRFLLISVLGSLCLQFLPWLFDIQCYSQKLRCKVMVYLYFLKLNISLFYSLYYLDIESTYLCLFWVRPQPPLIKPSFLDVEVINCPPNSIVFLFCSIFIYFCYNNYMFCWFNVSLNIII